MEIYVQVIQYKIFYSFRTLWPKKHIYPFWGPFGGGANLTPKIKNLTKIIFGSQSQINFPSFSEKNIKNG